MALDKQFLDLANRLAVVAPRIDQAAKSSTPDVAIQPALTAMTAIITQLETDFPAATGQ